MRLVATNMVGQIGNGVLNRRWVVLQVDAVMCPLNERLNVLFCSWVKSDLALCDSKCRIGLEILVNFLKGFIHAGLKTICEDLRHYALSRSVAVIECRVVNTAPSHSNL